MAEPLYTCQRTVSIERCTPKLEVGRLKFKTKRRLIFYLNLVAIISLTVTAGMFFEYLGFLAWRMEIGLIDIKHGYFMAMAGVLFIIVIVDIVLFFRLILRRQYW